MGEQTEREDRERTRSFGLAGEQGHEGRDVVVVVVT